MASPSRAALNNTTVKIKRAPSREERLADFLTGLIEDKLETLPAKKRAAKREEVINLLKGKSS